MTTPVYPNDATAPVTDFPVVASVNYTTTGITTDFNLPTAVDNRGEVVAYVDGILQSTYAYDISNSGATVSFITAPNASLLALKTVTLPTRFRLTRTFPAVRTVEYSNTTATVVNGNTFSINGNIESYSLPEGVNVSSSSDFMVFLSGVYQGTSAFTYPSINLGYSGIDIGDNTATKLLLNYLGNFTDQSPAPIVITNIGSVTTSNSRGISEAVFSGSNYLTAPSTESLNIHNQQFTLDTHFYPDAGTTMAANQTLVSRYEDSDNYYYLRLVGANANVGFVINSGGAVTELYGGNANGGSNYHVAVSYDINEQNIRLYVNNVIVSHSSYTSSASTTGPLEIGKGNTINQYFTGRVDFTRFATSARYRSNGLAPIDISTPQTVISGAPLGSIDSTDTLGIRVFDSAVTTIDRFGSMADRKPDRGIASKRSFDVTTFTSQAGYEKRRLKSRRSKREYDLRYTNISGIEKTAIENFYTQRSGEFESFIFDLSHINESGTITARFDKELSIDQTLSTGTGLLDNFYTVSFKLKEVFD
jgi:hypothetical protein